MNSTVKKYHNAFKSMEINKTTEDVDIDIKYLQIGYKLKYFGYYAGISLLSVGLYFGALNGIKEDKFRADLIEKAKVNPFSSFLYSDYSDELAKAEKVKDESKDKLYSLQKEQIQAKSFSYTYNDFMSDVKAGKVGLDMSSKLEAPIREYMEAYFMAYVVQNQIKTVALGSKEYSYIDIANKVKKLSQEVALEKLQVPAKSILDTLEVDKTKKNIDALANALHSLPSLNYRTANFYKSLKLKPYAKEEIKSAFYSGKTFYSLTAGRYGQKIELPKFISEYQAQKKSERALYDTNKQKMEARKAELNKEINDIKDTSKLVSNLISSIHKLKSDVANYDTHKEQIETILGELKWN